jgi:hypothetical protein
MNVNVVRIAEHNAFAFDPRVRLKPFRLFLRTDAQLGRNPSASQQPLQSHGSFEAARVKGEISRSGGFCARNGLRGRQCPRIRLRRFDV